MIGREHAHKLLGESLRLLAIALTIIATLTAREQAQAAPPAPVPPVDLSPLKGELTQLRNDLADFRRDVGIEMKDHDRRLATLERNL